MPLQFRRGTNAQRLTITPDAGEPIWTTNTNRLYVGDGVTPGGVAVEVPLPSTGTFVSLTVTNLHFSGDPVGVNQTTAWTGTVAWNAISSKPNNGLYTTSSVTFSNVTATNQVLINATGGSTYEPPHTTGYLVWGIESGGTSARTVLDTYGTVGSVITGRRARGTASAPTAAQNGDLLLRLAGTGFGTTQFASTSSGYIDVLAVENFTDGARGTKIVLNTTNTGTNTVNASLTVASNGTILTAPQVASTGSALTINQTGGTNYPAPPNSGQALWAISNDATTTRVLLDNYSTTPAPFYNGRAGRGTAASPSAVQANDILVSLRGNGYGTTGFQTTSSGFINIGATETFTDTARGTRFQFFAAADGERDPTLLTTIRPNGVFVYTTGTTGNGMLNIVGVGPGVYPGAPSDTLLQGVAKSGSVARITLDAYGANTPGYTVYGGISGRHAQGTSDAPTASLSGDTIVGIRGYAYGTTGFISTSSGGLNVRLAENATDSAAGGVVDIFVQQIGSVSTSTQLTVAEFDQTGLTMVNGTGITATNITIDNLRGGSGGNIQSYANITPNGTRNFGSLAAPWSNIYGSTVKTTNLTFADATNQTTAWTGSVSTSSVVGLSVVGWTNNYNDLTNKPNQSLNTGSDVQFNKININTTATTANLIVTSGNATINNNLTAGATTLQSLTVTTGSVFSKTITSGGFPLNAAGTASIYLSAGISPNAVFSNYSGGMSPNILIRGYGQNRPGGTASTAPNINFQIESSYGTNSAPTAVLASQNLGGFSISGYDGNNWASDNALGYNFMGWYSTEAMTSVGTSTYQAGSGFNLYIQPAWTRPGINATRQRIYFTSWTTATGGPSISNIIMGSGVDGTAPTMTMVDGTTYTGYGRSNFTLVNTLNTFLGVPSQDTAPDNATLTATNVLNLVASRRSAVSGRRNAIQSGDTVYTLNFRGSNGTGQTTNGVVGAAIQANALDTFGAGAYGTSMSISTVNTGTTTSRNRLFLSDRLMSLSADQYQFNSGNISYIPLSFTTSTWNASIDSVVFGNTAGTVSMLSMNTTDNNYNNTSHTFKDRTGSFTALNMTTSTAVFTAIPVVPNYTAAQANAITGQIGAQIAINDSASGGNPNGMMAFWDTTNNRWSYVHDNSAV